MRPLNGTPTRRKDFDPAKLQKELDERGLIRQKVSKEMGYSSNYLKVCMNDKLIAPSALTILEMKYNIKYEDIAPTTEEPEDVGTDQAEEKVADAILTSKAVEEGVYRAIVRALPPEGKTEDDLEEVYKTIYSAVTHAAEDLVKNNWDVIYDRMQNMMFCAFYGAMKKTFAETSKEG